MLLKPSVLTSLAAHSLWFYYVKPKSSMLFKFSHNFPLGNHRPPLGDNQGQSPCMQVFEKHRKEDKKPKVLKNYNKSKN